MYQLEEYVDLKLFCKVDRRGKVSMNIHFKKYTCIKCCHTLIVFENLNIAKPELRPPLNKKLFPVHWPGGLKRAD